MGGSTTNAFFVACARMLSIYVNTVVERETCGPIDPQPLDCCYALISSSLG